MGCSASKEPAGPTEEEQQAEAENLEKQEQERIAQKKRRNSSLDAMARKGSLTPQQRMDLIAKEEEIMKKEKRYRERAEHHMWVANGSVGTKNHHYAGDEFKGERVKASADDSSDESDDDESELAHAKMALQRAQKYVEAVKKNREDLQRANPAMVGSLEYADQIAEAEKFLATVEEMHAKKEAATGYEKPEDGSLPA